MRSFLVLAVFLAACGGNADVSGNYTINLTNRENGCNFNNWTVDASTSGVMATLVQAEANVSATIEGPAAVVLDVVLGARTFTGGVDGDDLSLQILGTNSATSGNCTYTINATLDATLSGDALAGTIKYNAATNGNPDCATITGCESRQDFNGTRPPR